jgi:hypothetical protein
MRMLIAVYILAMVTANLLVWWIGPWASPFIAFCLIGLDLTLRDVMHDKLNRWQLLVVILAGGAITWVVNTFLRSKPWLVRSNGSNVVGAVVDSVVFPTLAFGSFLPHIVALQFSAKVGGGAVWSVLLRKAMPA